MKKISKFHLRKHQLPVVVVSLLLLLSFQNCSPVFKNQDFTNDTIDSKPNSSSGIYQQQTQSQNQPSENSVLIPSQNGQDILPANSSTSTTTPSNSRSNIARTSGQCEFDGILLKNGEETSGYSERVVSKDSICSRSTVTCTDGVVDGGNYYPYRTCSVAGCIIDGKAVGEGQTVIAYSISSSENPGGCTAHSASLTCRSGYLQGISTFSKTQCKEPGLTLRSEFDFGFALVGGSIPAKARLTLTGPSTGTADMMKTMLQVKITGSSAFQLAENNQAVVALASDQSVQIEILFRPTTRGTEKASLDIFDGYRYVRYPLKGFGYIQDDIGKVPGVKPQSNLPIILLMPMFIGGFD